MTESVVVDASIAIMRIRREVGWEVVNLRLAAWQRDGARLAVPSHFWLEVTNGLIRQHRMNGNHLIEAVHRLDEIGLITIELDRPLLLLAMDLAERHDLTMYDAAYLAIAESLGSLLFSADRELVAAAGSRGLSPSSSSDHRLSEKPETYQVERRSTWPDYSGASAYLAKLRSEATRPS
jgi:predicted nucleic acid-binding protein